MVCNFSHQDDIFRNLNQPELQLSKLYAHALDLNAALSADIVAVVIHLTEKSINVTVLVVFLKDLFSFNVSRFITLNTYYFLT